MTDPTPYDDDRSAYSRQALARLVLSDHAKGLSETACQLTVTRYDAYTGPGGRVSETVVLTRMAERLLADAVVYERERGSSWQDIAAYLGVPAAEAEERFTPAVERWSTAFDVPYRLDATGRKRIPQLPTAAYDPRQAVRHLDLWAHLRLFADDRHAVSAGLDTDTPRDEATHPELHLIDGRIHRENLGTFLDLAARYAGCHDDDTDRDAVTQALEATDDEDPKRWYSCQLAGAFHTLDVRLVNAVGNDVLSVVVGGARSPELRLRMDTLLAALAATAS
ncbi:hypothetical protein [Streptomyces sp. NBC_01320]|uniref:hypothetical protein n=1 Tax=Streptomyces sp. NBC_01320 TaxID=2903824 RepID=UPI002E11C7CB|nr:hypothetical protein OG395_26325 [Streptomyces sp. NBC_01320]